MALMDKLRAELIDIVEWVDDSQHTLVWRFPRFHNQIKNGAQLIVRPGQAAVMVCHGKLADVFARPVQPRDQEPPRPQYPARLEVRLRQPLQVRGLLRQHDADHRSQVGHAEPRHHA